MWCKNFSKTSQWFARNTLKHYHITNNCASREIRKTGINRSYTTERPPRILITGEYVLRNQLGLLKPVGLLIYHTIFMPMLQAKDTHMYTRNLTYLKI